MNFKTVLTQLNDIEALKGAAKKPLFKKYLQDNDFLAVVQATLDTSITYNVKNVKAGECYQDKPSDSLMMSCLHLLSTRVGATKAMKQNLSMMVNVSPERLDVVNRILKGNLGCGCSIKTINEVAPGLVPYFPYMRCGKDVGKLEGVIAEGGLSQLKANGMYLDIIQSLGIFQTRNGGKIPLPHFKEFFEAVPSGFVLSGEALVLDENGLVLSRAKGNAIINKALTDDISEEECSRIRFQLWDMVPEEDHHAGIYKAPCVARFKKLKNTLDEIGDHRMTAIETREVHSVEEAWDHYHEVRNRPDVNGVKLEGTVVKRMEAIWKDGTSSEQIKLKAELECELEVIGWKKGDVTSKWKDHLGSLICQSSCEKVLTDVGMGFSDEERLGDPELWVGQIISVTFNEMTKSDKKDTYALNHCRKVEKRLDKNEADDFEYIKGLK